MSTHQGERDANLKSACLRFLCDVLAPIPRTALAELASVGGNQGIEPTDCDTATYRLVGHLEFLNFVAIQFGPKEHTMEELRTFYTKWLLAAAVALATGTHLMASYVIPDLETKYPAGHWTVSLANVAMSRPVLLGLIILAEWLIRTKIWRMKWVHPELDFAGTWEGVSTYTHVHVGAGTVPRSVPHQARIVQDCLKIRLVPAAGQQFVRFESTAVNLIDAHRLVYAYYVKYHGAVGVPNETYGYEELNPVGDYDGRGRPNVLHGWFSHCARVGQTPLYSGTVVFTRKKMTHSKQGH